MIAHNGCTAVSEKLLPAFKVILGNRTFHTYDLTHKSTVGLPYQLIKGTQINQRNLLNQQHLVLRSKGEKLLQLLLVPSHRSIADHMLSALQSFPDIKLPLRLLCLNIYNIYLRQKAVKAWLPFAGLGFHTVVGIQFVFVAEGPGRVLILGKNTFYMKTADIFRLPYNTTVLIVICNYAYRVGASFAPKLGAGNVLVRSRYFTSQ